MPYLRLTCPPLEPEQRRAAALRLTDEINRLFYSPRGGPTRDALREHTTVHFTPYAEGDVYIGGRTPAERGQPDLTLELSDWGLSVRQRRRVAAALTPVLAELFSVPPAALGGVNIHFHPYPPTDFATGGRLLSDVVPRVGQLMKRLGSRWPEPESWGELGRIGLQAATRPAPLSFRCAALRNSPRARWSTPAAPDERLLWNPSRE